MIIKTILLINIFLPTLLFSFGASSMFLGLLIGNFINFYYLLCYKNFFYKNFYNKASTLKYIALILIILHGLLCYLFSNEDFNINRFILTVILILFLMTMNDIIVKLISNISPEKFYKMFKFVTYTFLLCGLLLIIQFSEFSPLKENTILRVFSEPGHFVLEILPLLLFITLVKLNKYFKLVIIIFVFLLILSIKSLLLIVGLVFIIMINLILKKKLKAHYLFFLMLFIIYFFIGNNDYYLSRINFEDTNDANLSKLVFLDGWIRAYDYLISSNGLGIGLQQFGFTKLSLDRPYDLNNILSENNINIHDGGTLGAKIIGEFGIFSLLFILNYFLLLVRCFSNFNKIYNSHPINLLAFSYLFFLSAQLFFRTSGYFSFFMFALIASYNLLVNLLDNNKITSKYQNNEIT